MDLFFWSIVFIVSLAVLVKSADYFTDSAEKIGLYLGLPSFIVGVTIVAVGTSLPELASSIVAVMIGSSEIVIGNVVGSNIANIFLVLGFAALLSKNFKLKCELSHVNLPFLMGSALFLSVAVMDGIFTFFEGVLFIIAVIIYSNYLLGSKRKYKYKTVEKQAEKFLKKEDRLKYRRVIGLDPKTIIIFLVSSILIYLGANYTVESIVHLSGLLSIGTEIIAISAVALGTSLPELFVSVNAARKGNPDLAVGNILGSNIFNALAVMGIPALLGTLVIPSDILLFGVPMMLFATFMYFFVVQDKEITKWEGGLLIIVYIFFIGKIIGLM